jgi:hypothetical protein
MPRYDFAELTDYDFESLVGDLLGAELNVRFELFTPGADQGIDLRHFGTRKNKPKTIAQAKRWAANSWPSLSNHLKKVEKPKLDRLQPSRYILATSVQLTPNRKQTLVKLLQPWLRSPADVFGRDDLMVLLRRHPDVEKRHIKLWLTSSTVLDAIINSGIAARTTDVVERTKRQLRMWVPNESFPLAKRFLEEHHLCVLAGPPGIGKTMLADVLLADYAARGFEPVVISEDVDEGDRVWRATARQVFHYDDFLGRVSAGELVLRKNEESRLAGFVGRVMRDPQKRLVMTTREYILAEAQNRYERLDSRTFRSYTYVLSLENYTRLIRARILYNHLWYSDLPANLRRAFLPRRRYLEVINHRHYNPRIIEQIIDLPHADFSRPRDFVDHLLAALDDPSEVWERIFENLPPVARSVLLGLATMPARVLIDDLEQVVRSAAPHGLDTVTYSASLRMLEGTFIAISPVGSVERPGQVGQRMISVRDPSVADYLRRRIMRHGRESQDLLERAISFDQLPALWDIAKASRKAGRECLPPAEIVEAGVGLLESPSVGLQLWGLDRGEHEWRRSAVSLEARVSFLVDIAAGDLHNMSLRQTAAGAVEKVVAGWKSGVGDKSEAVLLLYRLRQAGMLNRGLASAERTAAQWFKNSLEQREDWTQLLWLAKECPVAFPGGLDPLGGLASEFKEFAAQEVDTLIFNIDDPDWLEDEAVKLGEIASTLGVKIQKEIDRLINRAEELRYESEPEPDDNDWEPEVRRPQDEEREIDVLFASLNDD